MWITLFFVCVTKIFASSAQEGINLDLQSTTEVTESNQGVKWDTTRQPVTLNIRDGRSDRTKSQDVPSDNEQTLFYSNHWQPFVFPIGYNQYADDVRPQPIGSDYSIDKFAPTFLRRPDSDQNRTSNDSEKEALIPNRVPFAPIVYYPHSFNLYPSENDVKDLQNSSDSASSRSVSDSETSSSEYNPREVIPAENFPELRRGFYPLDFYRQQQRVVPPLVPSYFPSYPVLPFARGNPIQPFINPNYDRETGSVVQENITPTVETPLGERSTKPDFILPNEETLKENIASETSSNIVPPPFPVGGYPYGVIPIPPFIPHGIPSNLPPVGPPFPSNDPILRGQTFLPTVPPEGLPINPFPIPPFGRLQPENQVSEAVLPPIATNLPEPDVLPPQVDAVQPEVVEAPIGLGSEEILQDEKPNVAKAPYEFGFDMTDGLGTDQHRKEVSDGSGVVTGSYGYRDAFGVYRLVNYIADKDGFRAIIKSNEPGVASAGSANVIVMAERPPPRAIAEGLKVTEPEIVVETSDEAPDLIAAATEN